MTVTETAAGRGGIQAIARAASVLRALKNQRAGLSLAQIAARTGMPRSTVQRIAGALAAERLVIAAGPEGGLRLGPELHALAEAGQVDMVEITRPYLDKLSAETGETVDLAMPGGGGLVFIGKIPGTQRLRAVSSVGDVFPMTTTANGKACLALMANAEVEAIAKAEWKSRGGRRRGIEKFMAEIRAIRKSGVAYDEDEHTEGISAVGAAFHGADGGIYAVSVPAPTARFARSRAKLTGAILRARDEITAALAPARRRP